jgi:hypothetical protein
MAGEVTRTGGGTGAVVVKSKGTASKMINMEAVRAQTTHVLMAGLRFLKVFRDFTPTRKPTGRIHLAWFFCQHFYFSH